MEGPPRCIPVLCCAGWAETLTQTLPSSPSLLREEVRACWRVPRFQHPCQFPLPFLSFCFSLVRVPPQVPLPCGLSSQPGQCQEVLGCQVLPFRPFLLA